jgi:hypothetical protein
MEAGLASRNTRAASNADRTCSHADTARAGSPLRGHAFRSILRTVSNIDGNRFNNTTIESAPVTATNVD